jgi:hypothetical protein
MGVIGAGTPKLEPRGRVKPDWIVDLGARSFGDGGV